MKALQVQVYGKPGCDKCKVLNERLDTLLDKDEYRCFEKKYFDLDTEDGLIAFSESECINPQRIPAMIVARFNEDAEEYEPVLNRAPGTADKVCKNSKLYHYLGLQTDYSNGGGVLSPKMLKAVLDEAMV